MTYYGSAQFQEMARQDLIDWVRRNPRLRDAITTHDLQYLFEFHLSRGLSIDLRRFEENYYRAVFYPPEEKKNHIDEFVRKVCGVLQLTVEKSGKPEFRLTITVRHMISEVSHWGTFYIDEQFKSETTKTLSKKETDWSYRFPQ